MAKHYSAGRILIVDDEASVRVLLEKILTKAGMKTLSTGNPGEVIGLCDSGAVDLVLLDLKMPDVNGWEVCEQIRSRHPSLPVIMLTGQNDSATRAITISDGADDFISKPVDPGEVLIRVKNALHIRNLEKDISKQRKKFGEMKSAFAMLNEKVEDIPAVQEAEEATEWISDLVDEDDDEGVLFLAPTGDDGNSADDANSAPLL